MSWKDQLNTDPLPWLLEDNDPGVRYLALRDLQDRPLDDPELITARKAAHLRGPIAAILDAMDQEGYWVTPGAGYNPKYRGSVWAICLLAQLGAHVNEDERISTAYRSLLKNSLTSNGQFTMSGTPSTTIDCLQGNLCWSLLELGFQDRRLETAFDWMAHSVTGDGIAPMDDRHAPLRYYAGKCGPDFRCGGNDTKPCAWGAAKVMLAFSRLPERYRTPEIDRSIERGVQFIFSVDPADAAYPAGYADKPSGNWWKFGFPVFYITDLLQIAEAMSALGYGGDPRMARTLDLIRSKQDVHGRWALEYDYTGKTWVDFGSKKQPNKWVTLRALRVLKTTYAA